MTTSTIVVTAHLRWVKGEGHAEVVRIEGDAIELRTTRSAPPGAPLEAILDADPTVTVKIKSHGTKREHEGAQSFTMTGRLISASRELRDRLASLSDSLRETKARS